MGLAGNRRDGGREGDCAAKGGFAARSSNQLALGLRRVVPGRGGSRGGGFGVFGEVEAGRLADGGGAVGLGHIADPFADLGGVVVCQGLEGADADGFVVVV